MFVEEPDVWFASIAEGASVLLRALGHRPASVELPRYCELNLRTSSTCAVLKNKKKEVYKVNHQYGDSLMVQKLVQVGTRKQKFTTKAGFEPTRPKPYDF
jgi:hypothetical protein